MEVVWTLGIAVWLGCAATARGWGVAQGSCDRSVLVNWAWCTKASGRGLCFFPAVVSSYLMGLLQHGLAVCVTQGILARRERQRVSALQGHFSPFTFAASPTFPMGLPESKYEMIWGVGGGREIGLGVWGLQET